MTAEGTRQESRDIPRWSFLLLACVLPAAFFLIHRELGHQGDMRFFHDWYRAVTESLAFYRDGPGVNYPIVGVAWLCLPAWLAETLLGSEGGLDFHGYRQVLKGTLTAVEVLLIVACAGLARAVGVQKPRLLALAIYALPSSWAIGAWFGQLDVVGTLMLVLAAVGIVRFALTVSRGAAGTAWLLLGIGALHGAILTKQLTFFSLPGLVAMLTVGLIIDIRQGGTRRWLHLALVLASPLLWFVADPLLILPDGYWSHLAFVLFGGGSSHGDLLCASGANAWSLAYPGGGHSARAILILGLSARTWGVLLFSGLQLLWLFCFGREILRRPGLLRGGANREELRAALGVGLLLVGLSNLTMVTVLTGIHERYLVHGVPFLILGTTMLAGAESPIWRMLRAAVVLLGLWSGFFVLATLHWESFDGSLSTFRSTGAMGWLQLAVLLLLLAALVARAGASSGDEDGKELSRE